MVRLADLGQAWRYKKHPPLGLLDMVTRLLYIGYPLFRFRL